MRQGERRGGGVSAPVSRIAIKYLWRCFHGRQALIVRGSSSASFMMEGGRQVGSQQPRALRRGWNNRHPGARQAPRRPRDSSREPSVRRRNSAKLQPPGPTTAATYRQDPHLPSEWESDAPLKRLWRAATVSAAASVFFLFFSLFEAKKRGAQMWVRWGRGGESFFFFFKCFRLLLQLGKKSEVVFPPRQEN